ncbi:MAG: hypothetical protein MZV70_33160 [Desulfobacterales bacterium]|nr:hypothetical protein [Desulfobacterales bacterium]
MTSSHAVEGELEVSACGQEDSRNIRSRAESRRAQPRRCRLRLRPSSRARHGQPDRHAAAV